MPATLGPKESFRRRTWGIRMGIYAVILLAVIVGTGYVLTRSDDGGRSTGSSPDAILILEKTHSQGAEGELRQQLEHGVLCTRRVALPVKSPGR